MMGEGFVLVLILFKQKVVVIYSLYAVFLH